VHNGRFCITPDYPSGIYAYFVTIDASLAPTYPFVLGPTYYGTVQTGNTGPTGGHNTPSGTVTTYSPTTGIANTNEKLSTMVYPNPTSDYLFFFINPIASNNFTATLVDELGRVVLKQNGVQPTISYTFDVSQLPKGMYVLHLKNDSKEFSEKVLVK
jgi:hypothetical protein